MVSSRTTRSAAPSPPYTSSLGGSGSGSGSASGGSMTKWNSCPRHLYYNELAVRPRPPPNMQLYQQIGAVVVAIIALVVFLFATPSNSHLLSVQTVLDAVAGSVGLGVGVWSLLSSKSVEDIVTDWIEPIARLVGRGIWVWLQSQYTMAQSVFEGLFQYYMIIWQSMWSLLLQQQQFPFFSGIIGMDTILGTIMEAAGGTSSTTTGGEIAQGSPFRDATATTTVAAAASPAVDSALRVHLHSSMTEIDYQSNLEMHRSMTNYNYNNYSNTHHMINNSYSHNNNNNNVVNNSNQSRNDTHSIYTTSLSSVASGSFGTAPRTPVHTGLRQAPPQTTQTTTQQQKQPQPHNMLSPEELYSPALAKPFNITSITTTTKNKKKKKNGETKVRSHPPRYNSNGPGALIRLD